MERLAKAELEKAKANAEGERLLLEARNQMGNNLLIQELIQTLPDLMKEMAAPVGKINDIKLIHMGGMGNGNGKAEVGGLGETLMKSTMLYPIIKEFMDTQGLDLNQLLKDLVKRTGTDVAVKAEPVNPKDSA